ncbi:type II toxin-antitoxin system VapC family toxin [Pedobacter mendelii]|uniref:Twitching motility protein PilT n=1 Tax=Pedobacter mendelii TaxID=1908240 RepID=A0ABQ2BH03_9SPHI|nr:type II toxin-antitoxin system VapC family toxin [Pedobacter mendelii]GGI24767.1 twitching motility protein PilT [Pedobacter mendelii]
MPSNHYLLDTHFLIWFQENNPKIPEVVMETIQNNENTIYFSQISLFEIAIKQILGKLIHFYITVEDISTQALKDVFTFIPLENPAIFNYGSICLLNEHRDLFDRLIISTVIQKEATLLSADEKFKFYPDLLKLLW